VVKTCISVRCRHCHRTVLEQSARLAQLLSCSIIRSITSGPQRIRECGSECLSCNPRPLISFQCTNFITLSSLTVTKIQWRISLNLQRNGQSSKTAVNSHVQVPLTLYIASRELNSKEIDHLMFPKTSRSYQTRQCSPST